MNTAEWKKIENTKYEVSTEGIVRHMKHKHTIKPMLSNGYCLVRLKYQDINQHKYRRVHRLVAQAFLTQPTGKDKVNHKDGNKLNNALSNLEWTTDSENMKHYLQHNTKPKRVKLVFTNTLTNEVKEYKSIASAAREFELDATTVWGYSINGKWRHYTIKRIVEADEPRTPCESNTERSETEGQETGETVIQGLSSEASH